MKTFTQSDMILHDGEVLVISTHILSAPPEVKKNGLVTLKDDTYFNSNGNMRVVYYATMVALEGVKQLDRQKFVKPVDVEEMAENLLKDFWGVKPETGAEIKEYEREKEIAKAGHNANKAEFTREEMEQAMWDSMAFCDSNPKATPKDLKDYIISRINRLRPLSLPKSITIQNDEIINVEW